MTENPGNEEIMRKLKDILLSSGFARQLDELIAGQQSILERLEQLRVLRDCRNQSEKKQPPPPGGLDKSR